MSIKKIANNNKGSALLTVMLMALLLCILTVALLTASQYNIKHAITYDEHEDLYYNAELGCQAMVNLLYSKISEQYDKVVVAKLHYSSDTSAYDDFYSQINDRVTYNYAEPIVEDGSATINTTITYEISALDSNLCVYIIQCLATSNDGIKRMVEAKVSVIREEPRIIGFKGFNFPAGFIAGGELNTEGSGGDPAMLRLYDDPDFVNYLDSSIYPGLHKAAVTAKIDLDTPVAQPALFGGGIGSDWMNLAATGGNDFSLNRVEIPPEDIPGYTGSIDLGWEIGYVDLAALFDGKTTYNGTEIVYLPPNSTVTSFYNNKIVYSDGTLSTLYDDNFVGIQIYAGGDLYVNSPDSMIESIMYAGNNLYYHSMEMEVQDARDSTHNLFYSYGDMIFQGTNDALQGTAWSSSNKEQAISGLFYSHSDIKLTGLYLDDGYYEGIVVAEGNITMNSGNYNFILENDYSNPDSFPTFLNSPFKDLSRARVEFTPLDELVTLEYIKLK